MLLFSLLSSLFFGLFPWEEILIVDGIKAKLGQIPYQVTLQINGQHVCGGAIIDSNTILTAAHCFDKYEPSLFKAVAGIIDLNSGLGSTGQESSVNHALIHPEYNSITYANDIAVIKLATSFITSPYVASALLPHDDTTATGQAVVSGWGKTDENAPLSQSLLETTLTVLTEEQCQDVYGEDINSSVFCAGHQPGGNQDSCQGDSGGPVMCSENGQTVLCGLVSAGIGCGRTDSPGLYTSVSFFKKWMSSAP